MVLRCNVTMPLFHEEAEFILFLDSGLDQEICFGQWGKSHTSGGLKFPLFWSLLCCCREFCYGMKKKKQKTWTSLPDNASPWKRGDWPAPAKVPKLTRLQMASWLTGATGATPTERSRRTIQLNSSHCLPYVDGTQNCEQIKRCLFYAMKI